MKALCSILSQAKEPAGTSTLIPILSLQCPECFSILTQERPRIPTKIHYASKVSTLPMAQRTSLPPLSIPSVPMERTTSAFLLQDSKSLAIRVKVEYPMLHGPWCERSRSEPLAGHSMYFDELVAQTYQVSFRPISQNDVHMMMKDRESTCM